MVTGGLAGVVLGLLLASGCGSGSGGNSVGTLPQKPTATSTTTERPTTTTGRQPASTATTDAKTTTTTADAGTTTTSRTNPSSTSTTATSTTSTTALPTTTTEPTTSTTTAQSITSTTTAATTSTVPLPSTTATSDSSEVPWIALGALAAVAILVLVLALRSRSSRRDWWSRADTLVHDGRALVDLASAGPAARDPQEEIVHWGTIEQRVEAFANEIEALAADDVPDDAARSSLSGLRRSAADYLTALRTSRTLRIGPPAPTSGQLEYADAESTQRLAIVRATLDQLDALAAPHRRTN